MAGSTIPALSISPYARVEALKPKLPLPSLIFSTTIDPSAPALLAIPLIGSSSTLFIIFTPACSSSSPVLNLSRDAIALTKATPPPGTIPSSTAALVALSASSTLAFFSFISASVAAPTLITETPPANFANLS